MAIFHSPDGNELAIDVHQIAVVRPAEPVKQHVHSAIGSILYIGGQKIGVMETPQEAERLIKNCNGAH